MSPAKTYSYEIWKGIVGFVLWGLLSGTAVLLIAAHLTAPGRVVAPPVSLVWPILGTIALFAMLAGSLHFLVERRPRIIVDDEGVTDVRFSNDPIPWSAITGWHVQRARNLRSFLVLQIDPNHSWYQAQRAAASPNGRRFVRLIPARPAGFLPASPPKLNLPLIGLAKSDLINTVAARLSQRDTQAAPAP